MGCYATKHVHDDAMDKSRHPSTVTTDVVHERTNTAKIQNGYPFIEYAESQGVKITSTEND